jgi:hypothetical protein
MSAQAWLTMRDRGLLLSLLLGHRVEVMRHLLVDVLLIAVMTMVLLLIDA